MFPEHSKYNEESNALFILNYMLKLGLYNPVIYRWFSNLGNKLLYIKQLQAIRFYSKKISIIFAYKTLIVKYKMSN